MCALVQTILDLHSLISTNSQLTKEDLETKIEATR